VQLHSFLSSAIDGGECQLNAPTPFSARKKPQVKRKVNKFLYRPGQALEFPEG